MTNTRLEKDSLGPKAIPADALYGIQSLRAQENFPISNQTIPEEMIVAYAHLKKSCAQTNTELGLLDKKMSILIQSVCDELIAGRHREAFIVDVYQAGAGTSTNMNVNEVIANRVLELMKKPKGDYAAVSPNDHVNMAQSTNDTYPTAMRLAVLLSMPQLIASFKTLENAFARKAKAFNTVIKSARTHLQDAVPITLGQEFQAWARTTHALHHELSRAADALRVLGIGGSAAGTGLNTHPLFSAKVVQALSKSTGLKLVKAPDLIESMQSQRQMLEFAGALKRAAVELSRIASDLRLLASGPNTGFDEIRVPPVQPGSSIMPGKVNPSILECVNMVCYRVMGAECAVTHATHGGQLDLNVMMPLMASETLTAMKLLGNAVQMMAEKCVAGITVNAEKCRDFAYKSASLATALNPILGYAAVAEIVKEFVKTGKPLPEIILEKKLLGKKELEKILDPMKMTRA